MPTTIETTTLAVALHRAHPGCEGVFLLWTRRMGDGTLVGYEHAYYSVLGSRERVVEPRVAFFRADVRQWDMIAS